MASDRRELRVFDLGEENGVGGGGSGWPAAFSGDGARACLERLFVLVVVGTVAGLRAIKASGSGARCSPPTTLAIFRAWSRVARFQSDALRAREISYDGHRALKMPGSFGGYTYARASSPLSP